MAEKPSRDTASSSCVTLSGKMICVCGKEKMDGIKCRFGASHQNLEKKQSVPRYKMH